jgi:ribosomal-protein-alanine N-acetyltransferase
MEIEKACSRFITQISSILALYEVASEGFIVAEADGRVVGFLIGNLTVLRGGSKAGHVLSLAVDPAFRGLGIGRGLINYFSKACRCGGAKSLFLEVKKSNESARRFYSHLDFKEMYVLRRYYGMRGYAEDAVLMSSEL